MKEPRRECWYPVAFVEDLTPDAPTRVEVHGGGYVLFRDETATWRALRDRCPHRAARLSDGRLDGGGVECLYHGWRFRGDGTCDRMPQLERGRAIPETACVPAMPLEVRQGLAWLGLGDPDAADIPTVAGLDAPDCRSIDFAVDLPYDQDYLIENVLDYAHIHVAHDGARGGGHRALAGPLRFDVKTNDANGFTAEFGALVDGELATGTDLVRATGEFRAPSLVHYVSHYHDASRIAGLALYSVPLRPGRCRLLYRAYTNFAPLRDRLRPRFWEHGNQCHLLEQDMAVLMGQSEEIRHDEGPPRTCGCRSRAATRWCWRSASGSTSTTATATTGSAGRAAARPHTNRWPTAQPTATTCTRGNVRRAARRCTTPGGSRT